MKQTSKARVISPQRIRMSSATRKEQLLDIAERQFINQGYQGTSMEDIASAAGVSRPIVYGHFGSKDGVYLACLQRARARLDERILGAVSIVDDPIERLRRGTRAYFEFVQSNDQSWDLLFGGGAAIAGAAAERALDLRLATVRQIERLIRQSLPRADALTVQVYAQAVSGAGEQMAKWWRHHPELTADQLAEQLTSFALYGMAPFLN
ncbi:hypothetical protein WT24_19935 [Burkholderia sp. MSMB1078WGS]|uniref:TetR/AcrR family transcriptional regulator n=1 Tax=Burkholderia sp. MSMB1078WGS TaxID=1637900 RepID=UPI00075C3801|nr:TetR/AcrR family transcriptional regulator [Burkholderia sp. MSMB1078WGS]KVT07005.1 hypothetical protein WT24_19935 [Burkholderia sp. MSMB1078WGS]